MDRSSKVGLDGESTWMCMNRPFWGEGRRSGSRPGALKGHLGWLESDLAGGCFSAPSKQTSGFEQVSCAKVGPLSTYIENFTVYTYLSFYLYM